MMAKTVVDKNYCGEIVTDICSLNATHLVATSKVIEVIVIVY